MIGTPELTISVPCATCGGTGKDRDQYPKNFYQCADCKGTGVVRTPVSCASCAEWSDGDKECDVVGMYTPGDFGCALWTAKGATDGNG